MTAHYPLRRLHSLSGVFPVGVFLVVHLWTNASAAGGRAPFDRAVGEIQATPFLPLIELLGIALPITFHALYGVWLALRSRGNVLRYPYPRNWMFTLQRLTGFVAFAFIALHVAQLRVPKAFGALAASAFYPTLQAMLGEAGMFGIYLVGVTACVVHFANGLWSASQTWGLASSPRASRLVGRGALAIGLILWALGVNTLLHFFWRCGGLAPLPPAQRERACRDGDMVRRENSPGSGFTRAGHFPYTTVRAAAPAAR